MKSFKIIFMIFSALLLVCLLNACRPTTEIMSGTPPLYQNQDQLIHSADAIIYGEVVKEYEAKKINISAEKSNEKKINDDNMVLFTVFDVRVDEIVKGNLRTGDVIQVKQLGDKNNAGVKEIVEAGGYFNTKRKYIMFLANFEHILPGVPYETLNPTVGHLEIQDRKIKANKLFHNTITKNEMIEYLKDKVKMLTS